VNCHMPQTVYMQRHWRHDHGLQPATDPLLTRELGIPILRPLSPDKDTNWLCSRSTTVASRWIDPTGPERDRSRRPETPIHQHGRGCMQLHVDRLRHVQFTHSPPVSLISVGLYSMRSKLVTTPPGYNQTLVMTMGHRCDDGRVGKLPL